MLYWAVVFFVLALIAASVVTAPLSAVPLARIDAFIPMYAAAMLMTVAPIARKTVRCLPRSACLMRYANSLRIEKKVEVPTPCLAAPF